MLRFGRLRLVLRDSGSEPLYTDAGEVRGVSSSGGLPAPSAVVTLPRGGASTSLDSHRAEADSREFGSLKQ